MPRVTAAFLLARFIEGRPLGDAVIVALPHNVRVRRERKDAFDCLPVQKSAPTRMAKRVGAIIPNLDVSPTINLSPDTQDVLATPDA